MKKFSLEFEFADDFPTDPILAKMAVGIALEQAATMAYQEITQSGEVMVFNARNGINTSARFEMRDVEAQRRADYLRLGVDPARADEMLDSERQRRAITDRPLFKKDTAPEANPARDPLDILMRTVEAPATAQADDRKKQYHRLAGERAERDKGPIHVSNSVEH